MSASPGLGLVINTSNQPEYLARILTAVSRQTSSPEEVLLAEDGTDDATRKVFERWAASQSSRTAHLSQFNEGFRRARILNQAIASARADYLVFLDGDTLPHPRFVADHRALQRMEGFIQGHRALVKQNAAGYFGLGKFSGDRQRAFWTRQLSGWKHAYRWPWPLAKARADLVGIRGCNLAIWRADLVRVNGYNEDFVGWGREDSELAVRLMNAGVRRFDVRGWALCYHLWHPPANRSGLPANDELLAQAQRSGATRCERGLNQYIS